MKANAEPQFSLVKRRCDNHLFLVIPIAFWGRSKEVKTVNASVNCKGRTHKGHVSLGVSQDHCGICEVLEKRWCFCFSFSSRV